MDSANPLILGTTGDLDVSCTAAGDSVVMDVECSCRSNFFMQPSDTH